MGHLPDGFLPDGHLPDGHLPDASASEPVPSSSQTGRLNAAVLIKSPSEARVYRVYIDDLADGVDLSDASFDVEAGLTMGLVTVDNATTPKSMLVPISGGEHGHMYHPLCTANLSTGGPLVGGIAVRVMEGA